MNLQENNTKQSQSEDVSNKIDTKVKIIIAFFLGAIIAGTSVYVALPILSKYVNEIFIVFVVIIVLLAVIALILTIYKEFFFKLLFGISKADLSDVKQSSNSMLQNAIKQNWLAASKDFDIVSQKGSAWFAWLSYRRWVVTVFYTLFLAFAGLLGSVLLFKQNQLIETQNLQIKEQNSLFAKQNEKIDNQIQLEESNRRGALIVMMSNVMDEVAEELKTDWNNDKLRNLSPHLIGRISALSQSFRPYRFWQDSMLIERPLSPERGQLLLALVNSDLDSLTYVNIYKKTIFRNSYLNEAILGRAKLYRVDLSSSDLSEAKLHGAKLIGANLSKANLSGAQLYDADLIIAKLEGADLRKVKLKNTRFIPSTLNEAKVDSKNWIKELKEEEIKYKEYIQKQWSIDTLVRKDVFGKNYYLVKTKEGGPAQKGGR